MVALSIPSQPDASLAALQRRVAEADRRTIPTPPSTTNLPLGVVARSVRDTGNVGGLAGGVRQFVRDVQAPMMLGRLYRVTARAHVFWDGGAGVGVVNAYLNYTLDGTVPTASSSLLDHVIAPDLQPGGIPAPCLVGGDVACKTAGQTLRVVLSFSGTDGSRFYAMNATTDTPVRLWIDDAGTDPGISGTNY